MALKSRFEKMAEENGLVLSENADRIIKVKERAIDEYACPCHPNDPEHYCLSPLCKETALTKGYCDCRLFKKEM